MAINEARSQRLESVGLCVDILLCNGRHLCPRVLLAHNTQEEPWILSGSVILPHGCARYVRRDCVFHIVMAVRSSEEARAVRVRASDYEHYWIDDVGVYKGASFKVRSNTSRLACIDKSQIGGRFPRSSRLKCDYSIGTRMAGE